METQDRQRRTRRILIAFAIAGALVTTIVFATYFTYFNSLSISTKPAEWGPFGDFIGGVLNPFIGLLALFGLLWTIYQNQVELSQATEEMKRSADAMSKNNNITEQQSKKDELYRVISVIDTEINRVLNEEVKLRIPGTIATATLENTIKQMLLSMKTHHIKVQQNTKIDESTKELSEHLKSLDTYLLRYTEIQGDSVFEDYYRLRYSRFSEPLSALGLLADPIADRYKFVIHGIIDAHESESDHFSAN